MRVVLALLALLAGCALAQHERVLLKDVSAVTLYKGRMTQARRVSPIPQLQCVGGDCHAFIPDIVQCTNRGFDGHDVQWECKADLPAHLALGSVTVSCEGYGYPDDPYVLAGSCGLEYTIKNKHHANPTPHSGSSGGFSWGSLIVMGLVGYWVYRTCVRAPGGGAAVGGGGDVGGGYDGGGGGGGAGGGGGGGGGSGGFGGGGGGGKGSYGTAPAPAAPAAGPGGMGFWGGMGLGGVLGYLFRGGNNAGRQQPYYGGGGYNAGGYNAGGYNAGGGYGGGYGGGGYGGGGGGGYSGGGGGGGGSATSTSYGGTKRR